MRQCLIGAFATCAAVVFAAGTATAQDTVNVGFVLPMTGQLTSVDGVLAATPGGQDGRCGTIPTGLKV
jgi:hypothetical protein